MQKCYMCDKEATSIEHVPPKCLFPEFKEVQKDYRIDLFTVPSCIIHNQTKSSDDEFLMISLAGILGNNSIGYMHYQGKAQRALKRSSHKLLKKIFLKGKTMTVEYDNEFIKLIIGTPDITRLKNCFEHITYGIYYYHFEKKFEGKLKQQLSFLFNTNDNATTFNELIKEAARRDLKDLKKYGKNCNIFYYQITKPDEFGISLINLCFYENINVYVSLIPYKLKEKPFDLGMSLINEGIKTTIKINEKEFTFNKTN